MNKKEAKQISTLELSEFFMGIVDEIDGKNGNIYFTENKFTDGYFWVMNACCGDCIYVHKIAKVVLGENDIENKAKFLKTFLAIISNELENELNGGEKCHATNVH